MEDTSEVVCGGVVRPSWEVSFYESGTWYVVSLLCRTKKGRVNTVDVYPMTMVPSLLIQFFLDAWAWFSQGPV